MTQEKNTITNLLKYWPIVVFLGGLIVTWANFKNADANNVDRLNKLESRAAYWDDNQSKILIQLSQIQADLGWIRTKLGQPK